MSVVNNKNKRAFPIAGLLLCIFYVLFIAFVATMASSTEWDSYGGYDYVSGRKAPNVIGVLIVTGIALLFVIPWIYYFLNERKTDYKPSIVYFVFTILLVLCHCVSFFPLYDVVNTQNFGPVNDYVDRDQDSGMRLFAFMFFIIGTIVYIPVSIRMLIKIKRGKDNITLAEKIEG